MYYNVLLCRFIYHMTSIYSYNDFSNCDQREIVVLIYVYFDHCKLNFDAVINSFIPRQKWLAKYRRYWLADVRPSTFLSLKGFAYSQQILPANTVSKNMIQARGEGPSLNRQRVLILTYLRNTLHLLTNVLRRSGAIVIV